MRTALQFLIRATHEYMLAHRMTTTLKANAM